VCREGGGCYARDLVAGTEINAETDKDDKHKAQKSTASRVVITVWALAPVFMAWVPANGRS
jgi:hypothetical protein